MKPEAVQNCGMFKNIGKSLAFEVRPKALVVGAGKSGVSVALLLSSKGYEVSVSESLILSEYARGRFSQYGIPFFEQDKYLLERLEGIHLLVLSPGISLDSPVSQCAQNQGIPVVGEIEVASWFLPKEVSVIGITGTNGKSTTTHYAHQLMQRAGWCSYECGNIGIPLSDVIPLLGGSYPRQVCCVELSSYQLESTSSLAVDVSIFLNLQNDHLARHQTEENYLKAKWRLVSMTKESGLAILDQKVYDMAMALGLPKPSCQVLLVTEHSFASSMNSILSLEYSCHQKFLKAYFHDEILWEVSEPCLDGAHNAWNVAFASFAASFLGVAQECLLAQWTKETSLFRSLEHRLELIEISAAQNPKILKLINDSKATNVISTLVALRALGSQGSIRLLLGGEPKGDHYGPIADFFGHGLIKIYPFGKAASRIKSDLAFAPANGLAPSFAGMALALECALNEACEGDIILLSPACSSFDEFQNFEHRGAVFKQKVVSYFARQ